MFKRGWWLKLCIFTLILIPYCLAANAQNAQVSEIPITGEGFYIAVSPDSKLIAAAEEGVLYDNEVSPENLPIQLIDISTGKQVGQLSGTTDYASSLAFSPDGKTLASYQDNGSVSLWDIATKSLKRSFVVGSPVPGAVIQFLPDSQHLAIREGGVLPVTMIWDTTSGSMVSLLMPHFDSYQQFKQMMSSEKVQGDAVTAFDISPDGKYLVAATAQENVWLWSLADGSGKLIHQSTDTLPYLSIKAIHFSADGSQIGYYDSHAKTLHIWEMASSSEATPIPLDANAAVFSPDGQTVAWAKLHGDGVSFQPIAEASSVTDVPISGGIPEGVNLTFTPDGKEVLVNGGINRGVIDVVPVPGAS